MLCLKRLLRCQTVTFRVFCLRQFFAQLNGIRGAFRPFSAILLREHETKGRVGQKQLLSGSFQQTEGQTGVSYHDLVPQYKLHIYFDLCLISLRTF